MELTFLVLKTEYSKITMAADDLALCITRSSAIMALTKQDIANPSQVPMRNGVHLSEFVFQKSRAIASDFCGIQTHEGELRSAWASMINSISSTMFFFCDNFTKNSGITPKLSEITEVGNHNWVWKKSGSLSCTKERASTTCTYNMSVLKKDRKCKYIFIFHKINSAWQRLRSYLRRGHVSWIPSDIWGSWPHSAECLRRLPWRWWTCPLVQCRGCWHRGTAAMSAALCAGGPTSNAWTHGHPAAGNLWSRQ